jgi:glycosyltransferase involved in cell wall biosynthesis
MRVLHIGCSYLPYPGGGTVRLRRLVENYAGAGISLFLATHTPSSDASDDVPFERVLRDPAINSLKKNGNLCGFIREVQPDIVVLHNSRILMAWMLFYKNRFPGIRVICEIHSVRENTRIHSWLNRRLYQRCDCVVVLSRAMKSHLSGKMGNTPPRIEVIYSGVDDAGFHSPSHAKREYDPGSVHYAYVGSFYDWQGVLVLAEAVRSLGTEFWTKNQLTLAGSGPDFDSVKQILGPDILALENIRLLGWQPLEEIGNITSNVDFLLAPRISNLATELTVPLKVFESAQYGRPLIAARVGGLTELLDGEHPACVFIEPGSAASLAGQLRKPIDRKSYAAMQNRLSAMAKKMPRWKESSDQYIDMMNSIIRPRG